jgi:hypothetical protein
MTKAEKLIKRMTEYVHGSYTAQRYIDAVQRQRKARETAKKIAKITGGNAETIYRDAIDRVVEETK